MKDFETKYIILGLVIFFSLLISSIIIAVSVTKKNLPKLSSEFYTNSLQPTSKNDIIEGESIVPPIDLEVDATIESYQNQSADIFQNSHPTPLFPVQTKAFQKERILEKKSILQNLYKQSNKYYIKEDEKNELQPQTIKGIDD